MLKIYRCCQGQAQTDSTHKTTIHLWRLSIIKPSDAIGQHGSCALSPIILRQRFLLLLVITEDSVGSSWYRVVVVNHEKYSILSHINVDSTSFKFQKHLSSYDFIDKQKGFYSSYWDTGMYGNYFHVVPEKALDVIKLSTEGYACMPFAYIYSVC